MRRIEVTVAGRWYLLFTIGMGVTAIGSGNNVLYLLEALLLSGLLVSGILSERIIYSIDVELLRRPAIAGAGVTDRVLIRNRSRFTQFCIEVGEWRAKEFHSIAFVPILGGKEEALVPVKQMLPKRGIHRWEGIAVATAFPFGFARKVWVEREAGERIVWPERAALDARARPKGGRVGERIGVHFSEGEVRPMTYEDDARSVVWTLSAKGGERMVRQKRSERMLPEPTLDLRHEDGAEFERLVIAAAEPFYRRGEENDSGSLTLISSEGTRRLIGKKRALDALATIRAQGRRAAG